MLRLHDGDVEAGCGPDAAVDGGVGLHLDDQGVLLAAGVLVPAALELLDEPVGGSSTR